MFQCKGSCHSSSHVLGLLLSLAPNHLVIQLVIARDALTINLESLNQRIGIKMIILLILAGSVIKWKALKKENMEKESDRQMSATPRIVISEAVFR